MLALTKLPMHERTRAETSKDAIVKSSVGIVVITAKRDGHRSLLWFKKKGDYAACSMHQPCGICAYFRLSGLLGQI